LKVSEQMMDGEVDEEVFFWTIRGVGVIKTHCLSPELLHAQITV
jgi:hypothetical protein